MSVRVQSDVPARATERYVVTVKGSTRTKLALVDGKRERFASVDTNELIKTLRIGRDRGCDPVNIRAVTPSGGTQWTFGAADRDYNVRDTRFASILDSVRIEVIPNTVTDTCQVTIGQVNQRSQVVDLAERTEVSKPTISKVQRSPTIASVAELGRQPGVLNPKRSG